MKRPSVCVSHPKTGSPLGRKFAVNHRDNATDTVRPRDLKAATTRPDANRNRP